MSIFNKQRLYAAARETARELRHKSTPAERQFWQAIRRRQCGGRKFLRQYPILHDLLGRETYSIADFCCPALRLVIEIDGSVHASQKEHDAERDQALAFMGYHVLHFKNAEIQTDLKRALQRVLDTIRDIETRDMNRQLTCK